MHPETQPNGAVTLVLSTGLERRSPGALPTEDD